MGEVPRRFGDVKYNTWPSSDALLTMMRANARDYGLYDHTHFDTSIEQITVRELREREYCVHHVPVDPDKDGGIMMASAVVAWPGNLTNVNRIEWPGEEDFGGYIEY